MIIRSIHPFKPIEKYLQIDYEWSVYVKELISLELLLYINSYCSVLDDVKINEKHEKLKGTIYITKFTQIR